jgi:hypothetical protein
MVTIDDLCTFLPTGCTMTITVAGIDAVTTFSLCSFLSTFLAMLWNSLRVASQAEFKKLCAYHRTFLVVSLSLSLYMA